MQTCLIPLTPATIYGDGLHDEAQAALSPQARRANNIFSLSHRIDVDPRKLTFYDEIKIQLADPRERRVKSLRLKRGSLEQRTTCGPLAFAIMGHDQTRAAIRDCLQAPRGLLTRTSFHAHYLRHGVVLMLAGYFVEETVKLDEDAKFDAPMSAILQGAMKVLHPENLSNHARLELASEAQALMDDALDYEFSLHSPELKDIYPKVVIAA